MTDAKKTIVFLISLIAYFIYLSISSPFIRVLANPQNLFIMNLAIYISSTIGILIILYTQAGVKYWYTVKPMKDAKILIDNIPVEKFRFVDRLLVYILPALSIIIPLIQTRSLASINIRSVIFTIAVIVLIETLFYVNSKTMKACITDKGIVLRGIDLRLEIPLPSNYRNPSGFFAYDRILYFLDINDKIIIEQSYDLGNIILKSDVETIKKIKATLLANKVKLKRF